MRELPEEKHLERAGKAEILVPLHEIFSALAAEEAQNFEAISLYLTSYLSIIYLEREEGRMKFLSGVFVITLEEGIEDDG